MPDNQSPEKYQAARDARAPKCTRCRPCRTAIRINIRRWRRGSPQRCRMRSGRTSSTTRSTATRICRPPAPRSGSRPAAASMRSSPRAARAARSPASRSILKSRRRNIRCVLADPPGSSLYEYVRNGALKATGTGSITEGIGIAPRHRELCGCAARRRRARRGSAKPCAACTACCTRKGCFLGSTSGINVAAAVRVAREGARKSIRTYVQPTRPGLRSGDPEPARPGP